MSSETTVFFQQSWVWVGSEIQANYAYTNAMYHYLDFAQFGVFIFPLLFGILFRFSIKKFYFNASLSGLILLFYLFYVLIHTVFTWHLNKMYSIAFILFLLLMSNRKRNVL